MSPQVSIGLIGMGSVGSGVLRILDTHARDIAERLGAEVVVRRVAVRDLARPRAQQLPAGVLTDQVEALLEDPEIQLVVELMGGVSPARELVLRALRAGKPVITANKALLAEHGEELFAAATEAGVDIYYEGAVAGGIPIIRTLREGLASDRVHALVGIVNGTTNFILSEMAGSGRGFEEVLADAQARGFAEADPSADVDGHDAAQKLCLLAALCFGVRVSPAEVHTEGIRAVELDDVAWAAEFDLRLKLLAIGRRHEDGAVELRVHPTFIPRQSLLANVSGPFNAVLVKSEALGPALFYGQGAGGMPTGSAVVSDIIEAARGLLSGVSGRIPHRAVHDHFVKDLHQRPFEEVVCPAYLRFTVEDKPGVLGRIATALGEQGVSIRSLVQKEAHEHGGPGVPVVVLTHAASQRAIDAALATIDGFPELRQPTRRVRVEALEEHG